MPLRTFSPEGDRKRGAIAAVAALAMLTGCGSGHELVEVTGTVQLNGSPPPGPGSVFLAPIEDSTIGGARPAIADFDVDGKFVARAFGNTDGLKPGRYRVTVQIWTERPQGYTKPGVNVVPRGYELDELVVTRGEGPVEVTYNIELKPGR